MSSSVELRRDTGRYSPSLGPWIPKSLVAKVQGHARPDEPAQLVGARGERVGWGLVDRHAPIAFRMLSWGEAPLRADWVEARLSNAFELRARMHLTPETTGYRLVNSDHDGLPGLTIDRYGEDLRVRTEHRAATALMPRVTSWLVQAGHRRLILDADPSTLGQDAPSGDQGLRTHSGDPVPTEMRYLEHGLEIAVPCLPGSAGDGMHAYRPLRRKAAALAAAQGGAVLDLACHLGGFSLQAARRGLRVTGVDKDALRLQFAAQNAKHLSLSNVAWVRGDIFELVARPTLQGPYALVVLDHPEQPSNARDLRRCVPRLTELIYELMPRVQRGGYIVLCSDSPKLSDETLDRLVLEACHAQTGAQQAWSRIARWDAGADHPQTLCHPNASSLRALVFQRR